MSRNRNGVKEETDNRAEKKNPIPAGYKKVRDNGPAEDSVSTRGNSAAGKYSKTGKRKETIDKRSVRGGS